MTRVCLVGDDDVNLQYELLSRETARDALATYDLREPYDNTVAVETVSLGAAVALLNDLDWYLTRFVADSMVFEPSISDAEWLSRELAAAVRDDAVDPAETGRFLKVYGIEYTEQSEREDADHETAQTAADEREDDESGPADAVGGTPRLVEPMLVTRTGDSIPEYDLCDVEETLIVRVTESEFGA